MQDFDAERAMLKGTDFFPRFVVTGSGQAIEKCNLPDDRELIIAERGGEKVAFVMRELTHPHLAQGTLGGEPYLVTF